MGAEAMRCVIFQVAVGDSIPAFYKPCMDSVAAYAKRIGAEYIVHRDPVMKIVPKASKRSENALRLGYLPIFEKEAGFSYLQMYDAMLIVDADVFITPRAPNIFNELGDADFAGVVERHLPLKEKYEKKLIAYSRDQYKPLDDVDWNWTWLGADFYNMGVMLLGKSLLEYLRGESPQQFIQRPEFERFVNGEGKFRWSTDQTLLNWWVRKEKMRRRELDWRWNCLYDYVIPTALRMDPYFVHFNLGLKMPRGGAEIPEIIARLM